jgi:hypothetical protein
VSGLLGHTAVRVIALAWTLFGLTRFVSGLSDEDEEHLRRLLGG